MTLLNFNSNSIYILIFERFDAMRCSLVILIVHPKAAPLMTMAKVGKNAFESEIREKILDFFI